MSVCQSVSSLVYCCCYCPCVAGDPSGVSVQCLVLVTQHCVMLRLPAGSA